MQAWITKPGASRELIRPEEGPLREAVQRSLVLSKLQDLLAWAERTPFGLSTSVSPVAM